MRNRMQPPLGFSMAEVMDAARKLPDPASYEDKQGLRYRVCVNDRYSGAWYSGRSSFTRESTTYMRVLEFELTSEYDWRTDSWKHAWLLVGERS